MDGADLPPLPATCSYDWGSDDDEDTAPSELPTFVAGLHPHVPHSPLAFTTRETLISLGICVLLNPVGALLSV